MRRGTDEEPKNKNRNAAIPKDRGASESPTAQPGEAKPSGELCVRTTPR